MKTPIYIKTRKQMREELRQKYGNKGMRSVWKAMQEKKYGKEVYFEMRKATDPKGRHTNALLARMA